MDQLPEWYVSIWLWLAKPEIRFAMYVSTAVEAGLIFAFVFGVCRHVREDEPWTAYFAYGFLIIFVGYSARVAAWFILAPDAKEKMHDASVKAAWVALAACSSLNNLLFLAAAASLMLRKLRKWPWRIVILLAIAVALFTAFGEDFICHRLPDSLFSAFCVCALGSAIFICLRGSRRLVQYVRYGTLVASIVYGLLLLLDSIIPFVVNDEWCRRRLPALADILAKNYTDGDKTQLVCTMEVSIIVATFWCKLLLFLGAFVMIITSIVITVVPREATEIMQRLKSERAPYLANEGIVQALARVVGADCIELCILPHGIGENHVKRWCWIDGIHEASLPDGVLEEVPENGQSVRGDVLRFDKELICLNYIHRAEDPPLRRARRSKTLAVAAVPIRYSGAVIGSLSFWWRSKWKVTAAVRQRVRSMSPWLARPFESHRQLDAALACSRDVAFQARGDAPLAVISRLAQVVQRELTPLSTAVCLHFGFQSLAAISDTGDEGKGERTYCDDGHLSSRVLDDILERARHITSNVTRRDENLAIIDRGSEERSITLGKLMVVISDKSDLPNRPTLAADSVPLRSIAFQMTGAILDAFRQHFWIILRTLHRDVQPKGTAADLANWFEGVKKCADATGLGWVVAGPVGKDGYLGEMQHIEYVKRLPGMEKETVASFGEEGLLLHNIPLSDGRSQRIVELRLVPTGQRLWIKVPREGFGEELQFDSPWLIFLVHFAEIAGTAALHMAAGKELVQSAVSVAQSEALAAMAMSDAMATHDLANLARDVFVGTGAVLKACRVGRMPEVPDSDGRQPYTEFLEETYASARRMNELMSHILRSRKPDARRPCFLAEAVEQAFIPYSRSKKAERVKFECSIGPDVAVDVPFYIASHAFANLIANALDALRGSGMIHIDAWDAGDHVECAVTDNGPGVRDDIRRGMFHVGVSSKTEGGGWGLYLVRGALRANNADIYLDENHRPGARFVLRFPRPGDQGVDHERIGRTDS
jgi:signal transduction histidine kinase